MLARLPLLLALLLLSTTIACGTSRRGSGGGRDDDDSASSDDDDTSGDDDDTAGPCTNGDTTCEGVDFLECDGSSWDVVDTCLDPTPVCHPTLGCLSCTPGQLSCDGDTVMECDGSGAGEVPIETCPPDAPCVAGICQDPCAQAAAQQSYLGCDFLSISTVNLVESTFDNNFAVVVGNPASSDGPAQVTVSRGGSPMNSVSVAAGQTAAITLPMVQALKGATGTATVLDGAYEIHSTLPVAAYQYNPLDYSIGGSPSYTNDASLLLPEHALGMEYMVQAWPSFGLGSGSGSSVSFLDFMPGFVAVGATVDGTSVTLDFAGQTANGELGPFEPGQSTTVTLNRGDVLQVLSRVPAGPAPSNWCTSQGWQTTSNSAPGATYTYCRGDVADLTGSVITASAPVAVFGGSKCSFVPYDAWACDHLEEMNFPTATWGTSVVMSAPRLPGGGAAARTVYRVLALNDNTSFTLTPAVATPETLDAGEIWEFETSQDFTLSGTGRFSITQAMMGQDELGTATGDPALGTGIPWLQVRNTYDFLTPSTFTENWVNVVAETGTPVTLDGGAVSGWSAISGTGYSVARVQLSAGSHQMQSGDGSGFGITTYGYAPYTSYLYPGGMNFLR